MLTLFVLVATSFVDKEPVLTKEEQQILRSCEQLRSSKLYDLRADILNLDVRISKLKPTKDRARINELLENQKFKKSRYDDVESTIEMIEPPLLDKLIIGNFGVLAFPTHVNQVVGPQDMIAEFDELHGVWIDGVSTAGLVDGAETRIKQTLIVSGTKTYATALGSQRTIFLLKPLVVDYGKIQKIFRARVDKELAAKPRGQVAPLRRKATAEMSVKPKTHFKALLNNARVLIRSGNTTAAKVILERIVSEGGSEPEVGAARDELDKIR